MRLMRTVFLVWSHPYNRTDSRQINEYNYDK